MSSSNTQLCSVSDFKLDNVIFPSPQLGNIPNTKITFHRLPIHYKNKDGSIGDLVFCTEKIFSFGIKEQLDPVTKISTGNYTLPLCLFNRNEVSENEKMWSENFKSIVNKCKEHLLKLKEDEEFSENGYKINKDNLEDFEINSVYLGPRNKNKKVEDPNYKPILSPKLISKYNRDGENNEKEVITQFYDENGENINYKDLIGKYFNTTAAIKIEGIFINKKTISLQVKVLEAEVELVNSGRKSLLKNRNKN
jgi:hypothetical protein